MERTFFTTTAEFNYNSDLDLSPSSVKNDAKSPRGSSHSLNMSSASPRLSPISNISNDSSSPYLIRKVSADRDKHNVRPGAPSEPNEYNFNYRRRGLFIIFNNKHFHECTGHTEREGTDIDAERLEERFQDTGFEVRRYDDVTGSKMTKLIQEAARYDHSDSDCFGCAILSYGREGYIYAVDGLVPLEVLIVPFKADKCPSLVGKPKLFFIQACSVDIGDQSDTASFRSDDDLDISNVSSRKFPVEADFLFSYSTVPGHCSWGIQEGSWFIQALCIVLENYGSKMELIQMLTQVNRMVAYEYQSCSKEDNEKLMPSIISMLTRYIHFKPKKPDIRG